MTVGLSDAANTCVVFCDEKVQSVIGWVPRDKIKDKTCVSSSVKWACFLLLERLADSLLESILKNTQQIN